MFQTKGVDTLAKAVKPKPILCADMIPATEKHKVPTSNRNEPTKWSTQTKIQS